MGQRQAMLLAVKLEEGGHEPLERQRHKFSPRTSKVKPHNTWKGKESEGQWGTMSRSWRTPEATLRGLTLRKIRSYERFGRELWHHFLK